MGSFRIVWASFGIFWYLLVSFGFFWFLLVPFGSFWFLLVPFGSFWFLLVSFSFTHRTSRGSRGNPKHLDALLWSVVILAQADAARVVMESARYKSCLSGKSPSSSACAADDGVVKSVKVSKHYEELEFNVPRAPPARPPKIPESLGIAMDRLEQSLRSKKHYKPHPGAYSDWRYTGKVPRMNKQRKILPSDARKAELLTALRERKRQVDALDCKNLMDFVDEPQWYLIWEFLRSLKEVKGLLRPGEWGEYKGLDGFNQILIDANLDHTRWPEEVFPDIFGGWVSLEKSDCNLPITDNPESTELG